MGKPVSPRTSLSGDTVWRPLPPSDSGEVLISFALTFGEDIGLGSAETGFFRSRRVIEVGGMGMALRDDDGVMFRVELVSISDKMEVARSIHGSVEPREVRPPRRFLVACSSLTRRLSVLVSELLKRYLN